MPREYNAIQRGELQQRLTRGLLINEKSPAPTLDPTVQACVILEDLTKQNPSQAPAERRCGGGEVVGLVAAQVGEVAIVNPIGSGIVIVLESFTARTNGTGPHRYGFCTAGIAGLVPVQRGCFYDPRYGIPNGAAGRPIGALFAGTVGADHITEIIGRIGQGSTTNPGVTPLFGVVLIPNSIFAVAAETSAQEFSAFFRWVEYSVQ